MSSVSDVPCTCADFPPRKYGWHCPDYVANLGNSTVKWRTMDTDKNKGKVVDVCFVTSCREHHDIVCTGFEPPKFLGELSHCLRFEDPTHKSGRLTTVFASLHIDHHYAYQGFGRCFLSRKEMITDLKSTLDQCSKAFPSPADVGEFDEKEAVLYYTMLRRLGFPKQIWIFGFELELPADEATAATTTKELDPKLFAALSDAARKRLVQLGIPNTHIQF